MHDSVSQAVDEECARQREQYGEVNALLPDGTGPNVAWLYPMVAYPAEAIEALLRVGYERADATGRLTWMHLVREEVAEAFQESDETRLREELLQVAALCQSWARAIDARQQ
jgi:hypothetical protein